MKTRLPFLTFALALTASLLEAGELTYERDVRPILKAHCFQCHGEEPDPQGGLDVRLRRFLIAGGDSGAAIVPGKPEESFLIERIRSGDMPPGDDEVKKVPANELALLERWISEGAITAREEPETITGSYITEEERSFWSFQPVVRPDVPGVRQSDVVSNPIDAFLLSRLEEKGFTFAKRADKATLIRRLSFDLRGLPPSTDEVQQFLDDDSPNAFEQLVNRMLASADYGDRWGRHWLDVAGYADSEGYTTLDTIRPWAWKYRDWVVRSLNEDKPYDDFVREQLAGDELVKPPYAELPPEGIDRLIATGFLRMAPDGTGGGADDLNLARNEVMAGTLNIVSTSLLGMTVGCAQCHDHRYDPIPTTDYYSLRAIFEPAYNWKAWRAPNARRVSLYTEANRKRAAEIEAEAKKVEAERTKKQTEFIQATLEKELAKLPEEIREEARAARDADAKKRTPEQKALLKKHPSLNVSAGSLYLYDQKAADELKKMADQAKEIRDTKPKEEFVRAMTEVPGQLPKTFLFFRGDHDQPKQELAPASLTVLTSNDAGPIAANDESLTTTGRRLAWARRLTDGSHPLLARVIVNRVWMHHFGRGIVSTPGDFGFLGARPTHPELLDWLAAEFVESGWSLKRLHRLILTSTAWQQSLQRDPMLIEADPDNTLFGGSRVRRIEAETLRDTILAVTGQLNDRHGGEAVPVMADRVGQWVIGKENLNAGRPGPVIDMRGEEFRKSIFVQARRSRPLTVLDSFDLPRMTPNCTKRNTATVATQSLLLMNSQFIVAQSELFAKRVQTEAGTNLSEQVQLAWRLAYARPPQNEELREALEYLEQQTEFFTKNPVSVTDPKSKKALPREATDLALASLCQLLLGSNEFLYVD